MVTNLLVQLVDMSTIGSTYLNSDINLMRPSNSFSGLEVPRVCLGPEYECRGHFKDTSLSEPVRVAATQELEIRVTYPKITSKLTSDSHLKGIFVNSYHHGNDHPQHPQHPHLCNPVKINEAKKGTEE